jgi:hypothetical protein
VWDVGPTFTSVEDSIILTRFPSSDPIFSMGVDGMRPVFNLEPKYKVTMLTREEWSRGPGTPHIVKEFVWFAEGSRTAEGTGTGVYGPSWEEGSVQSRKTCYSLSG